MQYHKEAEWAYSPLPVASEISGHVTFDWFHTGTLASLDTSGWRGTMLQ